MVKGSPWLICSSQTMALIATSAKTTTGVEWRSVLSSPRGMNMWTAPGARGALYGDYTESAGARRQAPAPAASNRPDASGLAGAIRRQIREPPAPGLAHLGEGG